jgi:UDP-N-acetylmuramoyl-tripeptide--D-alanyl-D-alanine ligase
MNKNAVERRTVRNVGVEQIVGAIGRRPGRRIFQVTGVSTDSRTIRPGEIFFALPGARVDGHDFVASVLERGAAAAVVSRAVTVPPQLQGRVFLVADTLRALGDSARAYRRAWGGRIVAVTGSNGKTTTREMIHHLLSDKMPCKRSPRSYNTDVGVPLTLFMAAPEDRALVVEMGTNAPGEIAELAAIAEPDMGVITSIAETHLEGLGSIAGVANAKAELLDALGEKGTAFLNADDAWFKHLAGHQRGPMVSYGVSEMAAFRGQDVEAAERGYGFTIRGGIRVQLPVPGWHNVSNALAALAVADHFGLDLADAARRFESFQLPEMRYQVECIRGVTVVFDGYNANPGSMRAALQTFRETRVPGRKVAVLGDMLELGENSEPLHRSLGADVARAGVTALWAVGRFAPCVAVAAGENGLPGPAAHCSDLDLAAGEVCGYLKPGDALLIKGSRGMKLERLVEKLRACTPAHGWKTGH